MRSCLITIIIGLLHLANASAMTVSGDIVLLTSPPVSAAAGDLVSNNSTYAWTERQAVWPTDPYSVDVIPWQNNVQGVYTSGD